MLPDSETVLSSNGFRGVVKGEKTVDSVGFTDSREFIEHVCVRAHKPDQLDPFAILEATAAMEWTRTALIEEFETSKATLDRALSPLVHHGLVDANTLSPTHAWTYTLFAVETALESVALGGLAFLSSSPNRAAILQAIRDKPVLKSELRARPELPSSATLQRTTGEARARGWMTRDEHGRYELTPRGERALAAYERLLVAGEQVLEKTPFLCCVGAECVAFAPESLAASEMIVKEHGLPTVMIDSIIDSCELRGDGVRHLRAVVPVFSQVMYDAFAPLVGRGTQIELVFDRTAYRHLRQPQHLHYLATAFAAPNVEFRIAPKEYHIGYGASERGAVIGGADSDGSHALLLTRDSALVTWTNETIDRAWEDASPPSKRLTDRIRRSSWDNDHPSEAV